LGHPVESGA